MEKGLDKNVKWGKGEAGREGEGRKEEGIRKQWDMGVGRGVKRRRD